MGDQLVVQMVFFSFLFENHLKKLFIHLFPSIARKNSNGHSTQQPKEPNIFFTSHAVDKTGKIEVYVKKLKVFLFSLFFFLS